MGGVERKNHLGESICWPSSLPQTREGLHDLAKSQAEIFYVMDDEGEEVEARDNSSEIEEAKDTIDRLEFQKQMGSESLDLLIL